MQLNQAVIEFNVPGWLNTQFETVNVISQEEYDNLPESFQPSHAYVGWGWAEMPGYAVTNGWCGLKAKKYALAALQH